MRACVRACVCDDDDDNNNKTDAGVVAHGCVPFARAGAPGTHLVGEITGLSAREGSESELARKGASERGSERGSEGAGEGGSEGVKEGARG